MILGADTQWEPNDAGKLLAEAMRKSRVRGAAVWDIWRSLAVWTKGNRGMSYSLSSDAAWQVANVFVGSSVRSAVRFNAALLH